MKLRMPNDVGLSQPDPYIIKANEKFYIYATGVDGVKLYRADELLGEWSYLGIVAVREGFKEYWAPSVIELDGVYYMYVSCMPNEESDAHTEEMCVFTAGTPEGPFVFQKKILEPFTIDSHIVKNEAGLFLFYSPNDYESQKGGTHIVVDRMLDPYTPEGNPKKVVVATIDEELRGRSLHVPGKDWYTIEGGFYFRKGNHHYVMYSGNCYESEYYFVGYAHAETEESDLTKIDFKKYPSDDVYAPLLSKNDFEEGTGHNSLLELDGEYYIIYHGREWGEADAGAERRTARICRLIVDGEKLTADRYPDKL